MVPVPVSTSPASPCHDEGSHLRADAGDGEIVGWNIISVSSLSRGSLPGPYGVIDDQVPMMMEPRGAGNAAGSWNLGGEVMATKKVETTRRLNVHLTGEAHQRLLLHAMMTRQAPGIILSRLIDHGLREYHVRRNPTDRARIDDRTTEVLEVEISGTEAA